LLKCLVACFAHISLLAYVTNPKFAYIHTFTMRINYWHKHHCITLPFCGGLYHFFSFNNSH